MEPLKEMKLKEFSCHDTPLSDITPLLGMSSLTYLTLQKTRVSVTDIDKLQQTLPNCKITSE